jgi:hypothetical protein
MDILEFLEAIPADIGLTVGQILEVHFIKDNSLFNEMGRDFEEIEFISPAEIVITQYVFLPISDHEYK